MVHKIKIELLDELRKINKLDIEFVELAVSDYLINEHTIKKYLCRFHFFKRKREIHRKGCDTTGTNLSTKIVRDLSKKYDVSEQTVWNYLRK